MTKHQLAMGPQKCDVLGPTGLFQNALSAAAMAGCASAAEKRARRGSPQSKLRAPGCE